MMVFGTYDVCVHYWNELKSGTSSTARSTGTGGTIHEFVVRTPDVAVHAVAGSAAGIARSLFWIGWEAVAHRKNWIYDHPIFCVRATLHHATGYGVLFGVFQSTRQSLLFLDPISLFMAAATTTTTTQSDYPGTATASTTSESEHAYNEMTTIGPIIYTCLAGGMAGQIHHIVQHYTSHWKQFRSKVPPPPRLYPTFTSFGTMALCFVAFEHGSQVVDGWIEEFLKSLDRIMVPPSR
jgi:hypothetical protein